MDKKTATVSFGTESFTVPFETENDLFLGVFKSAAGRPDRDCMRKIQCRDAGSGRTVSGNTDETALESSGPSKNGVQGKVSFDLLFG